MELVETDRGTVYNRFESLDAKSIDKDYQSNVGSKNSSFDSISNHFNLFYHHEGRVNNH